MTAPQDTTRYLTLTHILYIQNRLIDQYGGMMGFMGADGLRLLASALARPMVTFSGQEKYETLSGKVAALCHSIVKNHAFIDGNKRLALAAVDLMLKMNDHELKPATGLEYHDFIKHIAADNVLLEEIEAWVKSNTRKRYGARAKVSEASKTIAPSKGP